MRYRFSKILLMANIVLVAGCPRRRPAAPVDAAVSRPIRDPALFGTGTSTMVIPSNVETLDVPNWITVGAIWTGQNSNIRRVHCGPYDGHQGTVWGTDYYSGDSSICLAALHSGLITREQGGVVHLAILDGASSYRGTLRNGVPSRNFHSFLWSFAFIPGPREGLTAEPLPPSDQRVTQQWIKTASEFRAQPNSAHSIECPPGDSLFSVWGTDTYTDDSSICSAAVHAGKITLQRGGTVTFFTSPGLSEYRGSVRNGVATRTFAQFAGSIVFEQSTPTQTRDR